jgi:hypothetical protein
MDVSGTGARNAGRPQASVGRDEGRYSGLRVARRWAVQSPRPSEAGSARRRRFALVPTDAGGTGPVLAARAVGRRGQAGPGRRVARSCSFGGGACPLRLGPLPGVATARAALSCAICTATERSGSSCRRRRGPGPPPRPVRLRARSARGTRAPRGSWRRRRSRRSRPRWERVGERGGGCPVRDPLRVLAGQRDAVGLAPWRRSRGARAPTSAPAAPPTRSRRAPQPVAAAAGPEAIDHDGGQRYTPSDHGGHRRSRVIPLGRTGRARVVRRRPARRPPRAVGSRNRSSVRGREPPDVRSTSARRPSYRGALRARARRHHCRFRLCCAPGNNPRRREIWALARRARRRPAPRPSPRTRRAVSSRRSRRGPSLSKTCLEVVLGRCGGDRCQAVPQDRAGAGALQDEEAHLLLRARSSPWAASAQTLSAAGGVGSMLTTRRRCSGRRRRSARRGAGSASARRALCAP